ncbi:hypothetical protein [Paenibacillus silagei]|uniref:ABC-2 type transport system permease protein n=1 Tax=Paenibacillus silagei TaxID=1670801 RepID=A0ABS4NX08_9BACL|nr:hypothetical protein [Paenibacillus silagei]MBP2114585.1 ABC-2 type transport system permease protein [Paenibacillus silagei]
MKWGMPVMTRSRLFFNSSIIRQNLRQHGWIGILYTLALLFILPLQLFIESDRLKEPVVLDGLFNLGMDIAVILIPFPIITGLFLSRYLQSKGSSDLMHSLPLRRSHLLSSYTLSGLLLLLPPIWITSVVTMLVRPLEGNMYIYQGAEVWQWCLTLTVLTLFLFAFTVFVGICVGQTVLQGVVTLILLVLPAAILMFIDMHLNRYLYGYPGGMGARADMTEWAPILRIADMSFKPFGQTELWVYALLSASFLTLSFVLYCKRHSEKAGQAMAFTYFDPLFKAGVMLCSMLLVLSYFGSIKQGTGWIIGSVVAGGIIGYIVVEMLLRKTWHILNRKLPLELAVYSILLGLLLYVPVSGLTGYETRVPANDKVSAVFAGGNYEDLMERPYNAPNTAPAEEADIYSKDTKYIEAVTALHHAVVTAKPGQSNTMWDSVYLSRHRFTLSYQLKSGGMLMRTYMVPSAGFEPELKAVMGHVDYKRVRYRISQMNKNAESIQMSNLDKAFSISDPQEVKEFKDILIREVLNMSYEDQVSDQRSRASIRVIQKPDKYGNHAYFTYDWYPSYHELGAWLEQKGYADKVRITAADVRSAEMFIDMNHSKLPPGLMYDPETRLELARSEKRAVMVTDKTLINGILEHRRNFNRREGAYAVKIVYKNNSSSYISLDEQEMSPALKALLP